MGIFSDDTTGRINMSIDEAKVRRCAFIPPYRYCIASGCMAWLIESVSDNEEGDGINTDDAYGRCKKTDD